MKFYRKEKILLRKGFTFLYTCRVSGLGRGKTFHKNGIFVSVYSREVQILYPDKIWINNRMVRADN